MSMLLNFLCTLSLYLVLSNPNTQTDQAIQKPFMQSTNSIDYTQRDSNRYELEDQRNKIDNEIFRQ